jgi:hypothetical protein
MNAEAEKTITISRFDASARSEILDRMDRMAGNS